MQNAKALICPFFTSIMKSLSSPFLPAFASPSAPSCLSRTLLIVPFEACGKGGSCKTRLVSGLGLPLSPSATNYPDLAKRCSDGGSSSLSQSTVHLGTENNIKRWIEDRCPPRPCSHQSCTLPAQLDRAETPARATTNHEGYHRSRGVEMAQGSA
jgi:hypothetical protein